MRRPLRRLLVAGFAAPALLSLLALLITASASADAVSPVEQCPAGDSSYAKTSGSSVNVTAPEGYLIDAFCAVGRGNAGAEVHTLSTAQSTAVVRHSSGRPLESYTVTYEQAPVAATEEPGQAPATASAERGPTTKPSVAPSDSASAEPMRREASAPMSEATQDEEPSVTARMLDDGEELQIARFEEEESLANRWDILIVGGIVVVGLLAGAAALLIRLPDRR